jgi:hypothetical protein
MRSDFGQKHLKHVMTEAQPGQAEVDRPMSGRPRMQERSTMSNDALSGDLVKGKDQSRVGGKAMGSGPIFPDGGSYSKGVQGKKF